VFEFRIHQKPEVVPLGEAVSISASLLAESRRKDPLDISEREVTLLPGSRSELGTTAPVELETVRARLFQFTPYALEHFIKLVFERTGFVKVSVTRASGDGGIDVNAYVEEKMTSSVGLMSKRR